MFGKEVAAILEDVNEMIVENFHSAHEISIKPDESIVTKTDREVENILIPRLKELLPESTIIGEESAPKDPEEIEKCFQSEYLWSVDPIDGTMNFAAGLPLFAVSVGLFKRTEKGYEPVSGSISFPAFSEVYFTHEGSTWLRNIHSGKETKIQRNPEKSISSLLVPNHYVIGKNVDRKNPFASNIRLLGSTAADMLFVSLGKATATLTLAHLWDIAAALAIAKTQDLYPRDLISGEVKEYFTKDDFFYGEPKQHWRLKKPLVLCDDIYFSDVKNLIKD
ncbi:inositol monophosphatase family protein [Rhodohalobacter sp. 614A]|uniref:inositol monophosphatase family protein n=1 Tax=Rhodohalobacter sp. 614A TaxID=2908649 RepID=UPI001F20A01A|nr:inositol monophosphatase family protein [Rhodohalobacter sp. 614A]